MTYQEVKIKIGEIIKKIYKTISTLAVSIHIFLIDTMTCCQKRAINMSMYITNKILCTSNPLDPVACPYVVKLGMCTPIFT